MSAIVRTHPRLHIHPQGSEGFLLPLAATSALVLLLSSLSVQAAVLHSRRLHLQQVQRQLQDDQLISAAHHLGADLQGPYQCLLSSPSSQWLPGMLPAHCPAGLDPQPWLRGLEQQHGVRVRAWLPGGAAGQGAQLQLQRMSGGPVRTWQWPSQPGQTLREVVG